MENYQYMIKIETQENIGVPFPQQLNIVPSMRKENDRDIKIYQRKKNDLQLVIKKSHVIFDIITSWYLQYHNLRVFSISFKIWCDNLFNGIYSTKKLQINDPKRGHGLT